ncbi:MAG: hypothetical protein CBD16_09530 [Betaproteobacteria bacterium TMED156]|nr:MAG: hypothetical protein CBD16_09530 [Betaproteobacteria bacterium TMED156]
MVPGSSPGGPTTLILKKRSKKMIIRKLKEIIEILISAEEDAKKISSGNASAGRRVRKVCMDATKDLKDLRAEILKEIKK